jgi:hypothetical protein
MHILDAGFIHGFLFIEFYFWEVTIALNFLDLELRFYMPLYLLNPNILFLSFSNFIWITSDEDGLFLSFSLSWWCFFRILNYQRR